MLHIKPKTRTSVDVPVTAAQLERLRSYRPKDPGKAIERALALGIDWITEPKDYFLVLAFTATNEGLFPHDLWIPPAPSWEQREFYRTRIRTDLLQEICDTGYAMSLEMAATLELCLTYGLAMYKRRKPLFPDMKKSKLSVPRGMMSDGKTWAGQAYFAGSGPKDTCGNCNLYQPGISPITGKELRGICLKYKQLMEISDAPKFPKTATACKYFEEKKSR